MTDRIFTTTRTKITSKKNLHYEVDFTRLWSDEAGQRRDFKHPDVSVATLDLWKNPIFKSH